MVRLTADLVWKSPHFFNALKERELDLRGIFFSIFRHSQFSIPNPTLIVLWFIIQNSFPSLFSGNKIAVIENLGATEVSNLLN